IRARGIVLFSTWLALGATLMTARADDEARPPYPPTPARPVTEAYHGRPVVDPYRWLENIDAEEVRAWAAAQTKVTRPRLNADPRRPELVEQLRALYDFQTTSAPNVRGTRYFFTRREGLKNQPIVYVREGSASAKPRVVLDPNTFSSDGTVALDWMFPSPDGALL